MTNLYVVSQTSSGNLVAFVMELDKYDDRLGRIRNIGLQGEGRLI